MTIRTVTNLCSCRNERAPGALAVNKMSRNRICVQAATFCVFTPEETHNCLHLGIIKEDKDLYFQETTENSFVVAIGQSYDFLKNSESCPCVNVVILDSDPRLGLEIESCQSTCNTETNAENTEVGSILTLFCTAKFLNYHKLSQSKEYCVQKLSPPPLTKVTLQASNANVFTWANSHVFSTGLLVNVCNQHKVLACKGNIFAIPHSRLFENDTDFDVKFLTDLTTVDAEPFHQGAITLKTEFVILNNTLPDVKSTSNEDEINAVKSRKPFAIHVSDFAVPQTSVFIPRLINQPVLWSDKYNNVHLRRDWHLIPCQFISTQHTVPADTALDHTVYITLSTAKKFSLFNESLIDIQIEPKGHLKSVRREKSVIETGEAPSSNKQAKKPGKVCRVANVKVLPTETRHTEGGRNQHVDQPADDVFLLTTSLWYNLHRQHNKPSVEDTLIKFRKCEPETEFLSSTSASWDGNLPYAKEVHISCVYSPQYSAGASYNNSLQKYFNIPRSLQQGDVFAVDTRVDVEFSQSYDGGSTCSPVVYFRVKRLSPRSRNKEQTYLVDTEHSILFQDGPCHSYVPSCLEAFLHDAPKATLMPGLDSHVQKLSGLLQPYLEKWSSMTESVPTILLHGASGCGKMSVCEAIAVAMNTHYFKVNCHDLCGETSSATEARIQQYLTRACTYSPCVLQLHNIHALGRDRDGNNEDARVASYFHECIQKLLHKESPDWPVVVIATTSALKRLSSDMHSGFLHTLEIEVPDEVTRTAMLESLLSSTPCGATLSLRRIAQRTAGFVLGDLLILVAQAKKEAYKDIMNICFPAGTTSTLSEEYSLSLCQPCLQQKHAEAALDNMQAAHCDAIGAPKIPSVTWDDVGGLAAVKADILDTIQLPLQHPELFAAGLRRSGVLLFGPPGTGKTLLAKAVATECSLNFLSVKGPELINMYVGQSEENIREVFSRARNATPCVIFFDELDSLAPNRGRSGDSGGVMDRVVSQLLAELDGLHKSSDVFVIGATNRPDLLDPALLRPGRFDKLLYLGVSEDRSSQLTILSALTRKFNLAPSCKLAEVVERCPFHMTGADFYALCSDAMLNALKTQIRKLDTGEQDKEETIEVCADDFYCALDHLVPSVSEQELQHYKYLKKTLTAGK